MRVRLSFYRAVVSRFHLPGLSSSSSCVQCAALSVSPRDAGRQTKSLFHNGDLAERFVSRVRARGGRSEPFDVPQSVRRTRAGLRTGQSRRTDIETWNFESVEHTVDVFQRWSYPVILGLSDKSGFSQLRRSMPPTFTGTALGQGCDLDLPVVVQRQAPIVQTLLGGSTVAVQRQGHRNICLDAADPCCSNDSRFHGCSTLTRRSMFLWSGVVQVPHARVVKQTVEMAQTQFKDRAVNVLWVTQRQVSTIQKIWRHSRRSPSPL